MLQLRRSPRLMAARLAAARHNAPYAEESEEVPSQEDNYQYRSTECQDTIEAFTFLTILFVVYGVAFYHYSILKERGY
jgi:hypothetical protein